MQRSNRTRQHHIFRVQPALAWGRNLKSPLRGTCRRHSVPYSRTENCSWVPPSREKHSRSGLTLRRSDAQRPGCLPLSWPHAELTRSPWTPAPHLPAPGTRARPQLCSQQPAVSVAARPFPATWSCSALGRRGADSRAYLRGGCGVGSAAGRGSLGSARGPLAQPPSTPHRRPEPARPECRVCPDGRWAPGARARPQATRAREPWETRGPRRPSGRRHRPGAGSPGSSSPELATRLVATARVQRQRGARNPGAPPPAPRPALPPRPPQPAAARDAPLQGSSPAPDRPPHLPPAPRTPRPPPRRLLRDRAQQPRVDVQCRCVTYAYCLDSETTKPPGNYFHSANPRLRFSVGTLHKASTQAGL